MNLIGPDRVVVVQPCNNAFHNIVARQILDRSAHCQRPTHQSLMLANRLGAVIHHHFGTGPISVAHHSKTRAVHRGMQMSADSRLFRIRMQMQGATVRINCDH